MMSHTHPPMNTPTMRMNRSFAQRGTTSGRRPYRF
jgi:hypothetical protein